MATTLAGPPRHIWLLPASRAWTASRGGSCWVLVHTLLVYASPPLEPPSHHFEKNGHYASASSLSTDDSAEGAQGRETHRARRDASPPPPVRRPPPQQRRCTRDQGRAWRSRPTAATPTGPRAECRQSESQGRGLTAGPRPGAGSSNPAKSQRSPTASIILDPCQLLQAINAARIHVTVYTSCLSTNTSV